METATATYHSHETHWEVVPNRDELLPTEINPYVYCRNNPLKYTDPTGMWQISLQAGVAVAEDYYFSSDTLESLAEKIYSDLLIRDAVTSQDISEYAARIDASNANSSVGYTSWGGYTITSPTEPVPGGTKVYFGDAEIITEQQFARIFPDYTGFWPEFESAIRGELDSLAGYVFMETDWSANAPNPHTANTVKIGTDLGVAVGTAVYVGWRGIRALRAFQQNPLPEPILHRLNGELTNISRINDTWKRARLRRGAIVQAYLDAGYSPTTIAQLFQRPSGPIMNPATLTGYLNEVIKNRP